MTRLRIIASWPFAILGTGFLLVASFIAGDDEQDATALTKAG